MKNREREIIYFALSRLLDDPKLSQDGFNEISNLRSKFYSRISELAFSWLKEGERLKKFLDKDEKTRG